MNLIEIIQDLIKFKTITGCEEEINKCMDYCEKLMKDSGALVDVYRFPDASPVLFVRNRNVKDFDVIVLGHLDVVPAMDEMFIPEIKDGKMYGILPLIFRKREFFRIIRIYFSNICTC